MSADLCSASDRMNDKASTVTLAHAPRVNDTMNRSPLSGKIHKHNTYTDDIQVYMYDCYISVHNVNVSQILHQGTKHHRITA